MAARRGKSKRAKKRARPSWVRRQLSRFIRVTVVLALLGVGSGLAFMTWGWPDMRGIEAGPVQTSAFIEAYAKAARRRPKMKWMGGAQLDEDLKLAVLVAEDARFFEHGAFDPRELGYALRDGWRHRGRMRGASTLTQQLAKNLWLSSSRSLLRKVREAAYAVALERRASKQRILEIYLNVVEMGPGVFGAEAAAQRFYETSAADLSPRQAAELAASLSRPSFWYPGARSEGYESRVQHILREMKRSPDVARAIRER